MHWTNEATQTFFDLYNDPSKTITDISKELDISRKTVNKKRKELGLSRETILRDKSQIKPNDLQEKKTEIISLWVNTNKSVAGPAQQYNTHLS